MADVIYNVEVRFNQKGSLKNPIDQQRSAELKAMRSFERERNKGATSETRQHTAFKRLKNEEWNARRLKTKMLNDAEAKAARAKKSSDSEALRSAKGLAKYDKERARDIQKAARQESARRRAAARARAGQGRELAHRGRYAVDGFKGIGSSVASGFSGAVDTMGSMLISGLSAAAATAGGLVAAGIGAALKEGISFADQMERAQISLASMMHIHLGADMNEAMGSASHLMEKARKDAAALPGEFKDILTTMKTIAPAAYQAGMSSKDIEEMAARTVAAAEAESVPQHVAARQLAMMLEGRMTQAQALGKRMGFSPSEIRKMKPEERVKAIQERMQKFDPAIDKYQNSWAGLTSNAKDQARNLSRIFAEPVFDSIKTGIARALGRLQSYDHYFEAAATRWGRHLRTAFELAVKAVASWYGPVRAFAEYLGMSLLIQYQNIRPYLTKLEESMKRMLSDPQGTIDKLLSAAKLLAGVKIGAIGMNAGAGMASMAAPFAKALVGSEGGIAAIAVGGAAAASAVALLTVAAVGAYDVLTDSSNMFHTAAVESVATTSLAFAGVAAELRRLWEAVRPLVDLVGVAFIKALEYAVTFLYLSVKGWADTFELFKTALYDGINKIREWLHMDPLAADEKKREVKLHQEQKMRDVDLDRDEEGLNKRKPPVHNTHIHGGINLQVMGNEDPFRTAKATVKVIRDELRNPTRSPNR